MTNLACVLTAAAQRHPGRIAVRLDEVEVPYAALDAASARLAGLLVGRGVRPGDRIGVMLPDGPYAAMAHYGILRAGAAVVVLDVLAGERETAASLRDLEVRAVLAWHGALPGAWSAAEAAGAACVVVAPGDFERTIGTAEPVARPVPRAGVDTAIVLVGAPGTRTHTHGDARREAEEAAQAIGLRPDDVVLRALPLLPACGRTAGLDAAVAAGACLTLLPRFDPVKALAIIGRDRVTVVEGAPATLAALLRCGRGDETAALRLCVSAGAPPDSLRRRVEEAFGCAVVAGSRAPRRSRNPV